MSHITGNIIIINRKENEHETEVRSETYKCIEDVIRYITYLLTY